MGCTFIVPSLTNQMVLAYFESLVKLELQKRRGGSFDSAFESGIQQGLVDGLSLQFGRNNTPDNSCKNWLRISENIVEDNLKEWAEAMSRKEKATDQMDEDIKKAVSKCAMSNAMSMADALKNVIS